MIYDLSKFVQFLCRHGITAHEFMLPYMLYLDERTSVDGIYKYPNEPAPGRAIANLYRYSENVRGWTPSEVDRLEAKGLIENRNQITTEGGQRRRRSAPDMMSVTTLFRDEIFAPESRWEEFVEVYPAWVDNFHSPDKPKIPLQMVGEPGAWEALEVFYNKVVKTRTLHEQVLDLVRWGVAHEYINMNISKFVSSRHWQKLQMLREQQTTGGTYGLRQYGKQQQ